MRLQRNTSSRSTDAQAFAIGAVLIIAIGVTVTAAYLAIYAPIETKKCEFQHASEVTEDFIMLNSGIAYLLCADSSVASTSVPIKMTPTKESRIALPLSPGSISFSQTAGTITVSMNESGTGTSGTWFISNFSNKFSLDYGNVKVEDGNLTLAGPRYSSARIVSTIFNTGSNKTRYETISWNATTPMDTKIVMEVRTSLNGDISNPTNWVEVENGENLSSILPTLDGHRFIQFRATFITYYPSERPTLIDIRINYSPFDGILANSSGHIAFESNYHYLPNHVLRYENGAVIKSQTAGEFLVSNFTISFNKSDAITRINISLINLTGTNVPVYSGAPLTSVKLFRSDYDYDLISDSFFYPNVTINLSSNNANACKKWFDKKLNDSSLTAPDDYNYTKVSDSDFEIEFYGHGDGVQLYLEKTTIHVRLTT